MQLIMYRISYKAKDAPVCYSFLPFPPDQKHTFTFNGKVYEGVREELTLIVPDDAKVDVERNRLTWADTRGKVKSTAKEVVGFAQAKVSGFLMSK